MDIYCTNCAEPWDAGDWELDKQAIAAGRCESCNGDPAQKSASPVTGFAAMVYDLSGDDFDGAAADLEDAQFWGFNIFGDED